MFIVDRSQQAGGKFQRKAKQAIMRHIKRRSSEFASVSIITYGARSKNARPQAIINKDAGKTLLLNRIRNMQQDEPGVTDAQDLAEALKMAHDVLDHRYMIVDRITPKSTPLHEIVVLGKSGVGQYNSSLCMDGNQRVSYLFIGSCPSKPINLADSRRRCFRKNMCSEHTQSPKKALNHFFSVKTRSVFEKSPKQVRGGSNQFLMGFVNISSVVDTTRTQPNKTIYCLHFQVDTDANFEDDTSCEDNQCNLKLNILDAGPSNQLTALYSLPREAFFHVLAPISQFRIRLTHNFRAGSRFTARMSMIPKSNRQACPGINE